MSENITKNKRSYTQEFIDEAVSLALSSPSVTEVAKSLGIPDSTLHTWLKAKGALKKSSKNKDYADLFDENRKLHRELAKLRQEKEILKKAAAYFAQEQS